MSIDNVLDETALAMGVEASLEEALSTLSELAAIENGRLAVEGYLEQILMADGSVVDVLQAENSYKDWRADNTDLAPGQATTGHGLAAEMRATLESLYSPSMESDLIQRLKRTYHGLSLTMKTFGKDLIKIRQQLISGRRELGTAPVALSRIGTRRFMVRKDKPVSNLVGALKQDMAFLAACEAHYSRLDELTMGLGKRFREAARSDSDEAIRAAIDDFDGSLMDRSEYENLTKFKLLGNRSVWLDRRGFPRLRTEKGAGTDDGEGSIELPAFLKVVEQTITLNNRVARFAQMAAKMGERIQRMEKDMFDAYDDVNTEKNINENDIRIRELRALRRSARRGVAQHMFMGKAIATIMEDHASYIYRNVTTMANDVLKSTKGNDDE